MSKPPVNIDEFEKEKLEHDLNVFFKLYQKYKDEISDVLMFAHYYDKFSKMDLPDWVQMEAKYNYEYWYK